MKVSFAIIFGLCLSLFSFFGLVGCRRSGFRRNRVHTYEFFMPHVYPDSYNNHLCMKILIQDNFFLVGFEPKAPADTVHQMLLYGCIEPGSKDTLWNCDGFPKFKRGTLYDYGNPCLEGDQIIYGWGHNASGLHLPRGVGFHVGNDSSIKYLVLQVHYVRRYTADRTLVPVDTSGVILSYTKRWMPRRAGVIVLGTTGVIPANSVEHLETTCTISEDKIVHPIAFQVHTHRYGNVVSCYVVRQGVSGDAWSALAKRNPATPQAFYPVKDRTPLRMGDILAARCTMNNTSNSYIRIGNSDGDETCLFHLLYWVDNEPLDKKFCISPGPPAYYWERALENFHNIPDFHASIL